MPKPLLVLIHPSPDKDRLCSRRRHKSSIGQLNLPLLAAHADDRFDIRIIDENIEDIDFTVKPDLVGITLMTPTANRGYEIADAFRKNRIPVVLGGLHVYFMPDEAEAHADALLLGEAEYVWNDLLDDFLADRLQKRYQANQLHDLKGLPRPRLDLLKPGAYSFTNIMETARGCPHGCKYCAVTEYWGNGQRFRPVDEVIDEIRSMPPGDIIFIDDNIFGKAERAKELFRALIPLKRKWNSQGDLRVARDPELMDLAARSGCKWLFMGIESINSGNLKAMGKAHVNRVAEYSDAIKTIHRKGMMINGSFIFGLDHDDKTVFDTTLNYCIDNKIDCVNMYILTPMPGTDLFKSMERDGRLLHRNWSRYDANHVVFKPALMTGEELFEGYLKTYRKLYSLRSIFRRNAGFRRYPLEVLAFNMSRMINYQYFVEGCRV